MPIRRMPIGAELQADGTTHFRVWAPKRKRVEVVSDHGELALQAEQGGYFSCACAWGVGTRYRFRLDGDGSFPDPASRFQPEGPHGPSQVVDPSAFRWSDQNWKGMGRKGQIIYEMHVGTFTREGTWAAAERELPELAALGITTLEVMPVADFPGEFGWGYDGVNLFAPTRLYGAPDDMRRFIDRAHALGLAVILDVVYNHFGPDGNYLRSFADDYFTNRHANEWGEALNFDGPNSGPVRDFFTTNAAYWIDEYHVDGLRLDATHSIHDSSPRHMLAEIGQAVRTAALGRQTYIVAENEPQDVRHLRPIEQGGFGLDAIWNDDFHHSAMVALTGRNESYYSDYWGKPQEFVSAVKYGFLYQGQWYSWQKKRRGTPSLDLDPACFVTFVQNHDQIANSARGLRCHTLTSPGRLRALTALLLLSPGTPMLFQGQEFAASAPFLYFADHKRELAQAVMKGRRDFLSQFRSMSDPEIAKQLADPADRATFERCQLDLSERTKNADIYRLHQDLIHLRRQDPVFRDVKHRGVDGAVIGPETFVLRFFGDLGNDRLLVVNLGRELHLHEAPEPLLAPLAESRWEVQWSSESPAYGGHGTAPLETEKQWRIAAEAALVLQPEPRRNHAPVPSGG